MVRGIKYYLRVIRQKGERSVFLCACEYNQSLDGVRTLSFHASVNSMRMNWLAMHCATVVEVFLMLRFLIIIGPLFTLKENQVRREKVRYALNLIKA